MGSKYFKLKHYPRAHWYSIDDLVGWAIGHGVDPSTEIYDDQGNSHGPISDYIVF